MKYEEVYADHSYLWGIAPAQDMTGGYVDQDDLALLLKSPNKRTAKDCLLRQIDRWFSVGPEIMCGFEDDGTWRKDPKVKEIAEKYYHTDAYERIVEQ